MHSGHMLREGTWPEIVRDYMGYANIDVTQNVPYIIYTARKLRKYPLTLKSAGSESLQRVVASIRGQNGMRVCTCEICHRGAYASVYGGQKIGVNVARMGPGLHRCHTRDLSALIDIASRDYKEVGIRGN